MRVREWATFDNHLLTVPRGDTISSNPLHK